MSKNPYVSVFRYIGPGSKEKNTIFVFAGCVRNLVEISVTVARVEFSIYRVKYAQPKSKLKKNKCHPTTNPCINFNCIVSVP